MPLDPQIPLSAVAHITPMANPLQMLSDVMKIRADEMTMRKMQQDEADDTAMRQTLSEFGGDFDKSVEVIGRLLKAKASSRDYDSEKVGFNASA